MLETILAIAIGTMFVILIGAVALNRYVERESNVKSIRGRPSACDDLHLRPTSDYSSKDAKHHGPGSGNDTGISQAQALRDIEDVVLRGSAWESTRDSVAGILRRTPY